MHGDPLTVVVATRDRAEMLRPCLDSLRAALGPHDQLIVVDSCSADGRTAEVGRAVEARVLRCERPGASLARNAGWRAASTPVVAFVDDDVRVGSRWADALRAAFADHPDTAFVTGRLGLAGEDRQAERPVALFDADAPFEIGPGTVDEVGHGANLAVRRPALEAVGGYDERLGPGTPWPAAEDLDLIDRLLAAGCLGRYEPQAEAVHVQWRRRPDLLRLEWRYGVGQGARLARLRAGDRGRYDAVSRIVWRRAGVGALWRCVRAGYEFGALSALVRLAGTALGQLSAAVSSPRPGSA